MSEKDWYIKDNTCNYSTDWQPYKMDYDKFEYDIRLHDGREYLNCYPNASKFNSFDPKFKNGAGANIPHNLIKEIRFSAVQKLGINYDEFYNKPTTP